MSKKRMITSTSVRCDGSDSRTLLLRMWGNAGGAKKKTGGKKQNKGYGKERKDAEKASISLEGEYKPASFEQRDVNSDTIRWMCSAYAIYSAYNDKSLEVVGGLAGDDRSGIGKR